MKYVYTSCRIVSPKLIEVRCCSTCGALVEHDAERVMGRLPEKCRSLHGNVSTATLMPIP